MKESIISFLLLSLVTSGCQMSDNQNADIKLISKYVNISVSNDLPDLVYGDTSFVTYRTYGWFDLQSLEGKGKAVVEPFVYLRKLNDTIIVRPSDDIVNPYILTDHGRYWHCAWKGDGRGDSIKIDRFVINKNVYEYIQKRYPERGVEKTLISTNTFDPLLTDGTSVVENIIYLGISSEFDQHPEEHFLEILELAEQIFSKKDIIADSDSIQIYRKSTWDLRTIPTLDPNRSPRYIECKLGKQYHYESAPFGLYDEKRDISRPYFQRRIK